MKQQTTQPSRQWPVPGCRATVGWSANQQNLSTTDTLSTTEPKTTIMPQEYLSRIDAVRNHPKLGSHTPSIWTECYTDRDIVKMCMDHVLHTDDQVVEYIEHISRCRYERYLNSHSGDGPPRPCLLDGTEEEQQAYQSHLDQERKEMLDDLISTYRD